MGSRSLGELLLRPTSLSRISFAQSLSLRQTALSWNTHRMISNSSTAQPAHPQPKKQAAYRRFTPSTSQAPTSPNQTSAEDAGAAIDNLIGGMSLSGARPSQNSGKLQQERARNVFGSNFSNALPGQRPRSRTLDINSMDGLPLELPNQDVAPTPVEPEKQIYPRLNPAYGRTVELDLARGRDLVRGIGMLGSLMSRNKVRADFMKQRFHERNGLKRKRLKSERWRARFKKGFQEVTSRVQELTRKGW
ncbi:hypothetical protein N0V90_009607 [Kalmusia sp. IMI 367209]|nr:hypothetical protein N0V90_009607 [Kalmusia sp. IMI 367209]